MTHIHILDYIGVPPSSPRLLGLGISIMKFLIADVIQFVFGAMTTFAQGDGTKIKSNMIQIGDIYKFSAMNLLSLSTLFSHIVQMMMEEGYS